MGLDWGNMGGFRANKHDVEDVLVCSDTEVCSQNGNLYGEIMIL